MPSIRWPSKTQRLIAVDVETTGTGRIVQVGLSGNALLGPTGQLIGPEVDGWEERDVPLAERADIQAFAEYADELYGTLGGAIVVLHNGGNDLKHLERAFQAAGFPGLPPFHRAINTFLLAKELEPRAPSHKLGDLAKLFGIKGDGVSEWTVRLLITLMNRHPEVCDERYGDCFDVVSSYWTPKWTHTAALCRSVAVATPLQPIEDGVVVVPEAGPPPPKRRRRRAW
jgi:hypothetical protein